MAYGHRIASLDDELVALNERVTEGTVVAGSPGSVLVDFIPIREPPRTTSVLPAACSPR